MARTKDPDPIVPAGYEDFNPAAAGPEESEDFTPLSGARGPNPFKGWVQRDKNLKKTIPGATEPLHANVHVKAVLVGLRRDARENGMAVRLRVSRVGNDTLIQWRGGEKVTRKPRAPKSAEKAVTAVENAKPAAAKVAAKR